jgi:hypothetical protein
MTTTSASNFVRQASLDSTGVDRSPSVGAATAKCQPRARKHQVCDHCGGCFGMVTHRWWGNKFCKRTCKHAYLREVMLDRNTLRRWFGLSEPSPHEWPTLRFVRSVTSHR